MQFWRVPEQSSSDVDIIYTEDKQTRLKIDALSKIVTIEHLTNEVIQQQILVKKLTSDPNTAQIMEELGVGNEVIVEPLVVVKLAEQPSNLVADQVINTQIEQQQQQILSQLFLSSLVLSSFFSQPDVLQLLSPHLLCL